MMPRTIITGMVIVAEMWLGGCTVLGPLPDTSKYYVLASVAGSSENGATSNSAAVPNLSIGVGPIHMPQYLERREVARRVGPTRVEYSATDRWAEPPNKSLPRVLAEDLADLLGTNRVFMFPWASLSQVDYQVEVTVDRFDIDQNDRAELSVRWLIRNPAGGRIIDSGYFDRMQSAGSDGASQTAALSETLGAFSGEIANHLRRLQASKRYED
jgi:uncharacterized protein